jgi:predicted nucleotidyltransferase
MLFSKIKDKNVLHPPHKWVVENCHYLTIMGSEAYGASSGLSDLDLYGYCIPPKHIVFPWTHGYIKDFGTPPESFDQWQKHHIPFEGKTLDVVIFSIVKYFDLCMDCNPNMIDSLFTPRHCVVHSTDISEMVRDKRRLFLHKGAWHKFKGYSFAQMKKIRNKTGHENPARAADIVQHGYDTKYATHLIRLLLEVEQIMIEGDLDLTRNSELLKSVRRGDWSLEHVERWFEDKERSLETVYANSTLRATPDEDGIKSLLFACLEQFYGSIDGMVLSVTDADKILDEIELLVSRYR